MLQEFIEVKKLGHVALNKRAFLLCEHVPRILISAVDLSPVSAISCQILHKTPKFRNQNGSMK